MKRAVVIRDETAADGGAIRDVTVAAFATLEISNHTEQFIINAPGLGLEGVPREAFFALSFDGHMPQGTVTFHEAFQIDENH